MSCDAETEKLSIREETSYSYILFLEVYNLVSISLLRHGVDLIRFNVCYCSSVLVVVLMGIIPEDVS